MLAFPAIQMAVMSFLHGKSGLHPPGPALQQNIHFFVTQRPCFHPDRGLIGSDSITFSAAFTLSMIIPGLTTPSWLMTVYCQCPYYTVDRINIPRPWLITQVHPDINSLDTLRNLYLKSLLFGSKGLNTRVSNNAKLFGGAIHHSLI